MYPQALAIHPDYLLRATILDKLQQYWFPLSREGWQWVIVGMIRDRQIELALDKFREMQELDLEMEPWFLNFIITTLLSISAFPEAMAVLQMRCELEEPVSTAMWDHVLTTSAQSFAYPLVDFVWRQAVAPKYINPSSGVCTDILAVAARYGDFRLATDIFRILGQRSSPIYPHHYECLFEAYLNADDLSTALTVLSIMTSTPTPPTENGLSLLYRYLLRDPSYPEQAVQTLQDHRKAEKPVSIEVVNAILNAYGEFNDLDEALKIYDTLHRLVPSGPTTATYNALLRGCNRAGAKDKAMSLVAEMRAKKISPNALTYDRLILVCAKDNPHEDVLDAYRYCKEMRSRGLWPRPGTVLALVKALTKYGDPNLWKVLQMNAQMGIDSIALRRWVDEHWPRSEGQIDAGPEEDKVTRDEGSGAMNVPRNRPGESRSRRLDARRGRGGKQTSKEEMAEWDDVSHAHVVRA
jgi:pentatricopeptide repeat protein